MSLFSYLKGAMFFMNYGKLQLSFILLLVMTIILTLTCLFIVKSVLFTGTSIVAMVLCILGLNYTFKQEARSKEKENNKN